MNIQRLTLPLTFDSPSLDSSTFDSPTLNSPAFNDAILPANGAPAPSFRRCGAVIRRPLLSALLLLGAQGMLPAAPVMAQAEAVAESQEAMLTSVNINTASAAELAEGLTGIGVSKAEAIVRYREQFGPFESVDELSEVTGIGDSTVEKNRRVISIH